VSDYELNRLSWLAEILCACCSGERRDRCSGQSPQYDLSVISKLRVHGNLPVHCPVCDSQVSESWLSSARYPFGVLGPIRYVSRVEPVALASIERFAAMRCNTGRSTLLVEASGRLSMNQTNRGCA
jgi:hypothetical protein